MPRPTLRRPLLAGLALAATLLAGASTTASTAAAAPLGALAQLPGPAGCLTAVATDGCATTEIADSASVLAVSPDGRDVYLGGGFYSTAQLGGLRRGALGALTPSGPCFQQLGQTSGTCTGIRGLENLAGMAMAPDGRHVYVAAGGTFSDPDDATVTTWRRDPETGALAQVAGEDGCVTAAADIAGCRQVPGFQGISNVVASPDGRTVYALDAAGGSLAVLQRDAATGRLSAAAGLGACVRQGAATATCAGGRGLTGVYDVAVSPDGTRLYAAGGGAEGTLAIFARDAAAGTLTQLTGQAGCVTGEAATADCATARGMGGVMFTGDPFGVVVSADGTSLYVSSADEDTVTVFAIDPATGHVVQLDGAAGCLHGGPSASEGCTQAVALQGTYDIALSPDGTHLYGASYRGLGNAGGVPVFARAGSGVLTQLAAPDACVTGDEHASCTTVRQLHGATALAVSPDGETVYAAGFDSSSVAVLTRQQPPTCADSTATVVAGDTVALPLTCREPNGEALTRTITHAPAHGTLGAVDAATGTVAYTPAPGFVGDDAVRHRASDGERTSGEATVRITVTERPAGPPPGGGGGGGGGGAGDGAPRSAPPQTPPGPQPQPRPTPAAGPRAAIATAGAVRLDARGRLTLRVRCTGAAGTTCRGRLTVRSTRAVRVRRGAKARRLTLGSATYVVRAGATATVRVPVGREARTALGRLKRVAATVSATPSGGGRSVTPAALTVRPRR